MEVKMKKDNKELIEEQNLLNSDVLKSKITFQIEDKNYTLQMFILQEIKKLKLILEITDKNKSKSIYSNSFSLYDLISLNTFFSKFKDDYEAFNYLMNNYTKVDKTNEVSNNKEIKLSLLFTITEDYEQNNIKQQKIEFILHNTNMNVKYKSNLYLTNTIQNLKMTLEKFNSSISELKSNIDKEKIRKKNIKLELENLINNKFEEIKENKSINEIKLKIKNIEDKKMKKIKNKI
jgi:predicted XRE-type DNA-binding protein